MAEVTAVPAADHAGALQVQFTAHDQVVIVEAKHADDQRMALMTLRTAPGMSETTQRLLDESADS
jgi:hypothetical protein